MSKPERLDAAVAELSRYEWIVPMRDFDRIVERHGLDPHDDDLVMRIVQRGWQFCAFDNTYIAP